MATTGTLRRPVDVTVTATATSEVTITWSTGAGDVAPLEFYVSRHTGSSTAAACGGTPTKPIEEVSSCTDLAVPDGDHTYVVTAVYRSWTDDSTSSEVITVLAPVEPEIVAGMDQAAGESTPTPTATDVEVTTDPGESPSPSPTPASATPTPTPTSTPMPAATPTPSILAGDTLSGRSGA